MSLERSGVNDFVIRFSNINGTGSASANKLFAKSLFRMGIPISPKNIFPSNIQGLPTWYEIRVNGQGYLSRRDGIDILVGVNPQTLKSDIDSIVSGGYLVYDSSKPLHDEFKRPDINYIDIPMMSLSMKAFTNPRQQQLFKNVIYVGALIALLDIDEGIVRNLIEEQFKSKQKLIPSNMKALEIGMDYARSNFKCPINFQVETCDKLKDEILIDGNTATALGLIYGGATFAAWYPITPSTSVAQAFEKYANKLRKNDAGKNKFAVVQAEDELAAMGMVIGATWNGSRAFTATSGPGVSLMNEFIGLAYFAEIPVTLINVQRGGPSTGMPTRTQQADLISSAYASHGDTKHVLLFPSTPQECFTMAAQCLDLADRLQTPIILMTDLDLGMNDHVSPPLTWDDDQKYDRGKIFTAEDLDSGKTFGRYLDVDGDGIPYRTLPATHPTKGSFFTRGTSHDEFAKYSESGEVYVRVVDRLSKKWETAKTYVPKAEVYQSSYQGQKGIVFFGTTTYAALEAMDQLKQQGIVIDAIRLTSFPFDKSVEQFIEEHDELFIIEQNRDAQMRTLIINELETNPQKLKSILNYDGTPVTADLIIQAISAQILSPTMDRS